MSDIAKVVIPVIHKLNKQMGMFVLTGVQHMSMEPPHRLQARDEPFNMYPYIAQRHDDLWDQGFSHTDLISMKEWCWATLNANCWHYNQGNFYFRTDADRIMFMLRWS